MQGVLATILVSSCLMARGAPALGSEHERQPGGASASEAGGNARDGGAGTPADGVGLSELQRVAEEQQAAAASPDAADLRMEDIDLGSILNVEIVTAAGRSQRMAETPGVVTVIDREDIEAIGPMTLAERLSLVPGLELMESYYGYSSLTFRGVLQTHYNSRSLLMVNGHPLYEPLTGSFFLAQVPQPAIERVEVVRGPGSTLYGTNAYAGVTNIITRRPKPGAGTEGEAYALGGSFWTNDLGFGLTSSHGDLWLNLFAEHHDSQGWRFRPDGDEDSPSTTHAQQPGTLLGYEDDTDSVYGGVGLGDNLSVNFGFFRQHRDKWGLIPATVSTGPRELWGWLGDASYLLRLGDAHSVSFSLRHDGYAKRELIGLYPPAAAAAAIGQPLKQRYRTDKTGLEIRYDGKLAEWAQVIVGGSADLLRTNPYVFRFTRDTFDPDTGAQLTQRGSVSEQASAITETHTLWDLSTYLDLDLTPLEWVRVSAGVRQNHRTDYGAFVAPRGAVVALLPMEFSLKALYGRAYRAPSIFETTVRTANVLYGGDVAFAYTDDAGQTRQDEGGLEPETLDTVELALEWHHKGYMARVLGFRVATDDIIDRTRAVPADSSLGNTKATPSYANSEGYEILGVEVEHQGRPSRSLRYLVNFTYRVSRDKHGEELPAWAAPYLANLGGYYNPVEQVRLAVVGQLIGERSGTLDSPARTAKGMAPENLSLSPYFLLNAEVAYLPFADLEVAVSVKNLLDEAYSCPEYIRQVVPEVPGGPGRTVYGKLKFRY